MFNKAKQVAYLGQSFQVQFRILCRKISDKFHQCSAAENYFYASLHDEEGVCVKVLCGCHLI